MRVRVQYGAHAGTVMEFPYAVGLEIVAAGRGERVPDEEVPERVDAGRLAAVPARQDRDPTPPVRFGSPRRRAGTPVPTAR